MVLQFIPAVLCVPFAYCLYCWYCLIAVCLAIGLGAGLGGGGGYRSPYYSGEMIPKNPTGTHGELLIINGSSCDSKEIFLAKSIRDADVKRCQLLTKLDTQVRIFENLT